MATVKDKSLTFNAILSELSLCIYMISVEQNKKTHFERVPRPWWSVCPVIQYLTLPSSDLPAVKPQTSDCVSSLLFCFKLKDEAGSFFNCLIVKDYLK